MDSISSRSAEGHVVQLKFVYGNHAVTIVGDGVGRTPTRRASDAAWHRHGPVNLLSRSMDRQRELGHGVMLLMGHQRK